PIVNYRTFDFYPSLLKHRSRTLNIGLVDREGEMLSREFAFVFLQHNHPCVATSSQEYPIALVISNANLQIENFTIKGFRLRKILNFYCDFINTTNRQHRFSPNDF